MKRVFLISGKSNSGKDQFGTYLRQYFEGRGDRVLYIHFGDAVKFFLTNYYHWDGKKDIAGRRMLQTLGTNIMRKQFPTYWADIVSKFIFATHDEWDYVIIPDWRFRNELDAIYKYNNPITTIRVNRLTPEGDFVTNPEMTDAERMHSSECELDDIACGYMISNNGTLERLHTIANTIGYQESKK